MLRSALAASILKTVLSSGTSFEANLKQDPKMQRLGARLKRKAMGQYK
jgi:hypothetical protein